MEALAVALVAEATLVAAMEAEAMEAEAMEAVDVDQIHSAASAAGAATTLMAATWAAIHTVSPSPHSRFLTRCTRRNADDK